MDSSVARGRLADVVRPDSITTSQGDFLATHVSLKRLHLLNKFDVAPVGGQNFSEEAIYKKYILNPENRHQFIAVYGQSGTGKSHLIRWFEARYAQDKPDNDVVLFIRRSDNTLKGTIRQLLEKPEVQGIQNREVYERLSKATASVPEDILKDMIYHNFIIEIAHDDDSRDIQLTNVRRKRLEAFLKNDIVQEHLMAASGPIERMYSKIEQKTLVDRDVVAEFLPKDFFVTADLFEDIQNAGADRHAEKMARELMADESGTENAERIAKYLNQFVNDVIQRCAGIEPGDFRQIFLDIRRELYRLGKNLTLFIEDVTSFTGVDDALLDALIVEHTGMNSEDGICRISSIVGTTSNYLQNNFRDNHKDRITQFIYIPSDVLDQKGLFEFVGRYMNTMSLPRAAINDWMNQHAEPSEYPVHNVQEGTNWEFIAIEAGKELCLYPFTKASILYLYQYGLTQGHQTPRYIIRDMIEPVVNDILNNPSKFPSGKYNMINVNTDLSYMIHNQVSEEDEADRLLKFLRIWGNGKPDQYEENGTVYIAGIKKNILNELGFPDVTLSASVPPTPPVRLTPPGPSDRENTSGKDGVILPSDPPMESKIPLKIQQKVNEANEALTAWSRGGTITIATVGVSGTLHAAQGDLCSYLFSAINWQEYGLSADNISKVKNSSIKLVGFENQSRGSHGLYMLRACWESMNIMMAFIRWREFGGQSWNYPSSDFDMFLITSWTAKVEKDVVQSVRKEQDDNGDYIDAAVASEMYRLILCGEFRERSLQHLSAKYLFENKGNLKAINYHTREWKSLVSMLSQRGADDTNKETIRQYFNIPQGGGGSKIVLNEPILSKVVRRVKTEKLDIPELSKRMEDPVKLRRDVFAYYRDIVERVDSVAKAELANASVVIQTIYDNFGDDDIEEDDIQEFADKCKEFYDTINKVPLNIEFVSADTVRKSAKQAAKAILIIGEVLDEDDPLTILQAFASDPIMDLQPLLKMLEQLSKDLTKVDKHVETKLNGLGNIPGAENPGSQYISDIACLDKCEAFLGGGIQS